MTKEESLALPAQGREAWNGWAQRMLAERARMEAAGEWAVEPGSPVNSILREGKNDVTKAWLAAAAADFSHHIFAAPVDFTDFQFPADALFSGAHFQAGSANAICAKFNGAQFSGDAVFNYAEFFGDANFVRTSFRGGALFREVAFIADARFDGVVFNADVTFSATSVAKYVGFRDAEFKGDALFGRTNFGDVTFARATFWRSAWFSRAIFGGPATFAEAAFRSGAGFGDSTFDGFTSFAKSKFAGPANFDAVQVNRAFSLDGAAFTQVPNFVQSAFAEAPRLDNARFPKWRLGRDANIPARWRALRSLAIKGNDGDREQEFFAMEIRSARMATDFPWNLRFWGGWIYQITADFGRSILRPLAFWLLTMFCAATYFLAQHPEVAAARASMLAPGDSPTGSRPPGAKVAPAGVIAQQSAYWSTAYAAFARPQACVAEAKIPAAETNALYEAWFLAFRNAFILLDAGGDASYRTYGCLYGYVSDGTQSVGRVPIAVSVAGAVQKVLSGVFVFLFGLGLRNMLKMK